MLCNGTLFPIQDQFNLQHILHHNIAIIKYISWFTLLKRNSKQTDIELEPMDSFNKNIHCGELKIKCAIIKYLLEITVTHDWITKTEYGVTRIIITSILIDTMWCIDKLCGDY